MAYFQMKIEQIEDEKFPMAEMDLEDNYRPKLLHISEMIENCHLLSTFEAKEKEEVVNQIPKEELVVQDEEKNIKEQLID